MNLSQEQAHRLALMIKPSDVLEYINTHRSDYEEWLKNEEKKEQKKKEEKENETKICKSWL